MSVVVVARIHPLPGHRDEVVELFEAAIGEVHGEAGCELYALHEAADTLVMIEKWSSRDALDAHTAGEVLARLGRRLDGKLSAPADVEIMTARPAGVAARGAL